MKSLTTLNNYEKLREHATHYIYEKLRLDDIVSDSFFFVLMNMFVELDKTITYVVDSVGNEYGQLEKTNTYIFNAPAVELDTFVSSGIISEYLDHTRLILQSAAPLDEHVCDNCREEQQEAHVRKGH